MLRVEYAIPIYGLLRDCFSSEIFSMIKYRELATALVQILKINRPNFTYLGPVRLPVPALIYLVST